jgi:hypothetical protein
MVSADFHGPTAIEENPIRQVRAAEALRHALCAAKAVKPRGRGLVRPVPVI